MIESITQLVDVAAKYALSWYVVHCVYHYAVQRYGAREPMYPAKGGVQ